MATPGMAVILAGGKRGLRSGGRGGGGGKATVFNIDGQCPGCCEDPGPPQCQCAHSLPSMITLDSSSAGLQPPAGCGSCGTPTITSVWISGEPCHYETAEIPGCFGGVYSWYWDLDIDWNTTLKRWEFRVHYWCADDQDGPSGYAFFTGGTDPCDPTGTYIPITGAAGPITVGVP